MENNKHTVLRLPALMNKVGVSRAWIYDMEKRGLFPKRKKLGARAVFWLESEIDAWLQQRIEQSQKTNSGGENARR